MQEQLNHLMKIGDIKLFGKNEKESETLVQAMTIWEGFAWEKWAMLITESWKRETMAGTELSNQEKFRTPKEQETYNYLGILEVDTFK